jgi:hypothetical protein
MTVECTTSSPHSAQRGMVYTHTAQCSSSAAQHSAQDKASTHSDDGVA